MQVPESIHFLGWEGSVSWSVACFLLDATQPADSVSTNFFGNVVIVPTRHAGRRLRAELTRRARARFRKLVAPPIICTPAECLRLLAPQEAPAAAPPAAALLAMTTVLYELKVNDCRALFQETPTPPIRDWHWAEGLAELLLDVRETLANAPEWLDFAAIAAHPDNPEPERWADLARIEQHYRERLRATSLVDTCDLRHAIAQAPVVPAGWQRVWLAATPSPSPALLAALGRLPGGCLPVSVLVAAPESLRTGFNAWGCPKVEFWRRRSIEWKNFSEQVLRVSSPGVLVDKLAGFLSGSIKAGLRTTIGVLSSDLVPALGRAVKRAGAMPHNPEGEPQIRSELGLLLSLFRELLVGDEARAVAGLLRIPFLLGILAPGAVMVTVLYRFDRLCETHLPDTLRDMCELLDADEHPDAGMVARILGALDTWRRRFREDWVAALRALLEAIPPGASQAMREVQENILREVDVLEPLSSQHTRPAEDWLALVLRRLAVERSTSSKMLGSVPLLGWLELLWADAPQLILAGMNEGSVPENISDDPFLPGQMREKLGLPSNAERFAAAAYTLQVLIEQRRAGAGCLLAFVPQCDISGNPLKPSRLLFLAENDVLPGRVRLLFAEPEVPAPSPPWQAGWMFTPRMDIGRWKKLAACMRATQFRDYLDCPFRFYIRHIANMAPFNAWKMEPDARETGSLLHAVLEAFARDTVLRESTDAGAITRFAIARLEALLEGQYGTRWPLPVSVLADAVRVRLAAFANVQAARRKEGWQIRHAEIPFRELLGKPFCLDADGPEITGKIDRLDFHETGRWCIIDYKTSAKAQTPADAHLASLRKNATWPPDFACIVPDNEKQHEIDLECTENFAGHDAAGEKKRARRWVDLQLPLYRYLTGLALGVPFKQTCLAYFNLPQTTSGAGIQEWEGYSRDIEDAMLACVRGVQKSVALGRFWPPNPHPLHDDLEEFITPLLSTAIDPSALLLRPGIFFTD